jgi:hypothetical protein
VADEVRVASEILADHPRPLHPDRARLRLYPRYAESADAQPSVAGVEGQGRRRNMADMPADGVPGPFDQEDEL